MPQSMGNGSLTALGPDWRGPALSPGVEADMSSSMTSSTRRSHDHFEPQDTDPQEQRRLRGALEQIDYTVFASNREMIGQVLGHADAGRFQRLALAAAHARAIWVREALAMTETPHALDPAQVAKLAALREAYDELSGAYEAMRRMVERGYLSYRPTVPPTKP